MSFTPIDLALILAREFDCNVEKSLTEFLHARKYFALQSYVTKKV